MEPPWIVGDKRRKMGQTTHRYGSAERYNSAKQAEYLLRCLLFCKGEVHGSQSLSLVSLYSFYRSVDLCCIRGWTTFEYAAYFHASAWHRWIPSAALV